jgi:hypothetical protein
MGYILIFLNMACWGGGCMRIMNAKPDIGNHLKTFLNTEGNQATYGAVNLLVEFYSIPFHT